MATFLYKFGDWVHLYRDPLKWVDGKQSITQSQHPQILYCKLYCVHSVYTPKEPLPPTSGSRSTEDHTAFLHHSTALPGRQFTTAPQGCELPVMLPSFVSEGEEPRMSTLKNERYDESSRELRAHRVLRKVEISFALQSAIR